MRYKHLVLLLLFFASLTKVVAQNDTINLPIKNFHWVDKGVYRSSQPDAAEFAELEKAGVKEVLNIRRFNSDDDEAKDTNLKLNRIKVRASQISEKHLLEAMRIIKNREGDILIHCHHGSDRTGAVIATYRIVFQGWSKVDAISEMKGDRYGFNSIFRNIPKLIQNLDVEDFKKKLFTD